jgi:hypothetical protein
MSAYKLTIYITEKINRTTDGSLWPITHSTSKQWEQVQTTQPKSLTIFPTKMCTTIWLDPLISTKLNLLDCTKKSYLFKDDIFKINW